MERKFRCKKAYRDDSNKITICKGAIATVKDGSNSLRVGTNKHWVGDIGSPIVNYNWEEITQPRIKLVCEGFEEGVVFRFGKNKKSKYKVIDGKLKVLFASGWKESGKDVDEVTQEGIELIRKPTEKELIETEMREKVAKHKEEMDALADRLKSLPPEI